MAEGAVGGAIAETIMGQSPPGYTVIERSESVEAMGGLPFIQGNAEFGRKFPTPSKWCVQPQKVAEADDVLFSVRAPVGDVNKADQPLAIGRGVAAIRFTGADPGFGWHSINESRNRFERVAQGSTFEAIGGAEIRALPIFLPPVPKQRAIADVLDSIDEAMERTEAVIASTETLRDSLLHELLTRGVPGWHTEWKDVPGIGTIPADWEAVRLGDVATVNPKRPPLDCPPETSVTFLPMSAVSENLRGINDKTTRPFREVAKGYTYFEKNDVLFAKITPCLQNGKHALAEEIDGSFGFGTTEFHVVRGSPKIGHRFLFQALTLPENIEKCVRSFSGTAGQQRVQPEVLRALRLLLPSLPEQRAIADLLDGLNNTIDKARSERDRIKFLQRSMAEELLTGRRPVA